MSKQTTADPKHLKKKHGLRNSDMAGVSLQELTTWHEDNHAYGQHDHTHPEHARR